MPPATRSAVILIVFFFGWFVLTMLWVLNDARRIKHERAETKALAASGVEMLWVPAGRFTMGAIDGAPDEQPLHDVKVPGFFMDKTEVTNANFAKFVEATGYVTTAERTPAPGQQQPGAMVFTPSAGETVGAWRYVAGANWRHPEGPESNITERGDYPVVQVSWEDAAAYARWADKRLPTEAEWEYATRGGLMHAAYGWGPQLRPGGRWMANYWQGRYPSEDTGEDGWKGLAPTGRFQENNYGLVDLVGNASEWCADWYDATYYKKSPHSNPLGADAGNDPDDPANAKRVARGGSWLSSDTNGAGYRPSARLKAIPSYAASDLGFRCVRSKP
jgi:formylglycine-generating enzyme required for sulfatase activity